MRIDLWVPTASPMATPDLLAVIGREAEARGVGTIWVGEHVVLFEEYASSYPYADDGRIPAPPGTGLLEPLTTLSFLAATTSSVRLGTAMVLLPTQPGVHGQGGGHPRLAVRRTGRLRHRRGVAGGGVQRRQRAVAGSGSADRRVHRGAEDPVVRRDLGPRG